MCRYRFLELLEQANAAGSSDNQIISTKHSTDDFACFVDDDGAQKFFRFNAINHGNTDGFVTIRCDSTFQPGMSCGLDPNWTAFFGESASQGEASLNLVRQLPPGEVIRQVRLGQKIRMVVMGKGAEPIRLQIERSERRLFGDEADMPDALPFRTSEPAGQGHQKWLVVGIVNDIASDWLFGSIVDGAG